MDKTKTLEVLRGMKFMQRKEEAKRRELFENDQRKQLKERLMAATDEGDGALSSQDELHSGKRLKVATILYDTVFPRELYGFARRSFAPKLSLPETVVADAVNITASGANDGDGDKNGVVTKRERDSHDDFYSDDDDDVDNNDIDLVDDPTAVGYGGGEKRFCVNSRAPVLPKSLVNQMASNKQKKRTRRSDLK